MTKDPAAVYIVDGDPGIRNVIVRLTQGVGLRAVEFASGAQLLSNNLENCRGCLILDTWLPDMDGLALYAKLLDENVTLPTIMVSACADVRLAVQAMKLGALDFFEKPFQNSELLERIREGMAKDAARWAEVRASSELEIRLGRLTDRERQVLMLVMEGQQNKQIADRLGISRRTVETHRAHLREKLELQSLGTFMIRDMLQFLEPDVSLDAKRPLTRAGKQP